jgi:polyhydroxybutyrate depolymerase
MRFARNVSVALSVVLVASVYTQGNNANGSALGRNRCRIVKRPKLVPCPKVQPSPKTPASSVPTTPSPASSSNAATTSNSATTVKPSATQPELRRALSFSSGGRIRTAQLFVPALAKGESVALVLALHGGGGNSQNMAANTGLEGIAAQKDFAVVFPDGVDKNWNDGRQDAVSTAAKENIDDVAFLSELINEVAKLTSIDRKRVFATGMSNGAMMAIRLGCDAPQLFAGIAAVSGTGPSDLAQRCKPNRPISLLQIHGTADPIVPYEGGLVVNPLGAENRGTVIGVDELATVFATVNGCTNGPIASALPDRSATDGSTITSRVWSACRANTGVTFLRIDGGGHVWPGERTHLPERLVGKGNQDIDASAEIWSFFAKLPNRA